MGHLVVVETPDQGRLTQPVGPIALGPTNEAVPRPQRDNSLAYQFTQVYGARKFTRAATPRAMTKGHLMYLAMNRFTVPVDNATAFEELWLSRKSRLNEVPGFVEFHMLKGAEADGTILYASHTVWESEEHFLGWTRSDQFRTAHSKAGDTRKLHQGAPKFEGFTAIQHIAKAG